VSGRGAARSPRAKPLTASFAATRGTVKPGQRTTVTITVRNGGSSVVHAVTVCDTLPSRLKYVAAKPRATVRRRQVCFTVRPLKPGATAKLRVTAIARSARRGARAVNRVTVSARGVKTTSAQGAALRVLPGRG
jgi:uncharacterized repeat protein (TIGR01451 family)